METLTPTLVFLHLLLACQTSDRKVAGSTPDRNNPEQVVHTRVPLSPSSTIRYRPDHRESKGSVWPYLTELCLQLTAGSKPANRDEHRAIGSESCERALLTVSDWRCNLSLFVAGLQVTASNVMQLMVASDKLGISSVTGRCCDVIDRCPLDRVLQIISDASDIGLNDLALLDSKVSLLASRW